MTRPIRLFEEELPRPFRVKPIVQRVGLAAAAPILAFGLCPAHDEKHEHPPHEDHEPLAAVGRLAAISISSTSANDLISFGQTTDNDESLVTHWRARRYIASFTAATSYGSTSHLR